MTPDTLKALILFTTLFVGAPAVFVIGMPLAKALAARIAGRQLPEEDEVRELRESLNEAERRLQVQDDRIAELAERVMEAEERLDFAERMLAQGRPIERLESGQG